MSRSFLQVMRRQLTAITLFICITLSTTQPRGRRHTHRKQTRSSTNMADNVLVDTVIPSEFSANSNNLVQISATRPRKPPVGVDINRPKRSVGSNSNLHIKQSVCDSVSTWTEKQTAEDLWGNTVTVLNINSGGVRMPQYFYETYCREENSEGRGIDSSLFTSKCETKHTWAYARVKNAANEEGWNFIKVRSSCNCALYKKEQQQSLWNDLDLR